MTYHGMADGRIKTPQNINKGHIISVAIALATSAVGANADTKNPYPDAAVDIRMTVRY